MAIATNATNATIELIAVNMLFDVCDLNITAQSISFEVAGSILISYTLLLSLSSL